MYISLVYRENTPKITCFIRWLPSFLLGDTVSSTASSEQLGTAWPFHATELAECSSAPAAVVFPVCPRSACYVHSIINRSLSTLRLWLALSCAGSWLPRGGPSLQGVPRPEQAGLKTSRGPQRGAGLRQNVPWTQERGQATRYLLHVELSSGPACGEPHSPRITMWVGSECSTLPELKDSMCNLPIECSK